MIPSVIKASISLKFKMGDVKLNIQDTLNQIMPMMIPAILVGGDFGWNSILAIR